MEETKWLEYVTSILTAARDVIESFGVIYKISCFLIIFYKERNFSLSSLQ